MQKNQVCVSKTDLFNVIRDIEIGKYSGDITSPIYLKLVEKEQEAEDALENFRETCKELKQLERTAQLASKKVRTFNKKLRIQNALDVLKVRTMVRTQGVTPETVKAVKALAKKYIGVLDA